jgi:hypothetical protein
MVLERYEQVVVIKFHLPHLLQPIEVSHPVYALYNPEHSPQVQALDEIQHRPSFHLYHSTC